MTAAGVLLAAGIVLAQKETAQERPGFVVVIAGAGTFDGVCALDGAHPPVRLSGRPPMQRRLPGEAVSCLFEASGPLTVSINDGRGRRARSATSGGRLAIAIR